MNLHPHTDNQSSRIAKPAVVGYPQSNFSENYSGPSHYSSESPTIPHIFPSWQDFDHSPEHHYESGPSRRRYEYPKEIPQDSVGHAVNGGGEDLTWTAENLHNTISPSFLPSSSNLYQYAGLQHIEGSDNAWSESSYSPRLIDYPTPQSLLSPSPPQHIQASTTPNQTQNRGGLYSTSAPAAPHSGYDGLPRLGAPPLQEPRITSDVLGDPCLEEKSRPIMDESDENDEDDGVTCEPYAQLIFRALKGAPGHRMVLKDIYSWFEKHTNKANGSSKGWQNSIRHNLSMNGGFKKVDQDLSAEEAKRGFIWVLEPSALAEGVKSTTRYRKHGSNKKVHKSGHPAPERQRSGAKGGKATKKATKTRRNSPLEGAGVRKREDIPLPSVEMPTSNPEQPLTPASIWTPDSMETFWGTVSRSMSPLPTMQGTYGYEDIAGVTNALPNDSLFSEASAGLNDGMLEFHSFLAEDVTGSSPSQRRLRIP
ncbi:MAG: hypothetical protein Q9222_001303 [Ikaeria aurantiellina]